MGLFAFMVIPFETQAETNESIFFGSADIVVYDKLGNEMLTQTVHNRLTNEGENYILMQTFRGGNFVATDSWTIALSMAGNTGDPDASNFAP